MRGGGGANCALGPQHQCLSNPKIIQRLLGRAGRCAADAKCRDDVMRKS